jgi:glycosyltransferase involved in cell wall biosynthesis
MNIYLCLQIGLNKKKETIVRVIFLYVQDGASPNEVYNCHKQTANSYAMRVREEGYFWLLKRMVEVNIVDEVMVFIESNRGPGYIHYNDKISGYVMPDINDLEHYIREDDIIFVRGGFRRWYDPFLLKMREDKHWMLLYAANTGRERWPIWDVIFNDLSGNNRVNDRGTLQFDFKKPINPNIFYPQKMNSEFDLMLGASHIHDKKGQWRTINALVEYNKIFGENPKCIMPGSLHGGTKTSRMIEILNSNILDVTMPGMVSRSQLNKIYNRSKFFIHLGGGGQGDRGPLEAMRCGIPVIVGNTTSEEVARKLYYKIRTYNSRLHKEVYNYFEKVNGIETVILPAMATLFGIFRKYSLRNINIIKQVYGDKRS